jgi:AraC-like DNA-binding protein
MDAQLPTSLRGGLVLERRRLPARDGLVGLEQTFTGTAARVAVTHGAFIVSCVEVVEGTLAFPLAGGVVVAPRRFVLALPPRSVLPMAFTGARVESQGVAGFSGAEVACPALLPWTSGAAPVDLGALAVTLRAPPLERLEADAGAPPLIARARRLLHASLAHPAPVRSAARQVGLAPETLTRSFARAYGIAPKAYCHRARLSDAVLRLLSGAAIVTTAFSVGFGDLSRLYAQFRRVVGATPGAYARIRKRQDTPE